MVYRNYLFDRKLRNMLSFIIEHIEVAVKTRIAYYHLNKYEGKFPLWVIIEFFDFSDTSKMYSHLDIKLQKEIARTFKSNNSCFAYWLYCLTNLRNCCAHYARIYNTIMIATPATHKKFNFTFKNTLFSYLLVIKEILGGTSDWSNFIIELEALIEEYKEDIELFRLGFPKNWHVLLVK